MKETKQETLDRIFQQLEEGTKNVYSTETWTSYLQTMARFHQYSTGNSILIYTQKPDATYIAGYYAWKNNFHRRVKRGEKSIRILAPIRKYTVVQTEYGEEEQKYRVVGFRPAAVFDVSQTIGKDLPVYMNENLSGKVRDYALFREALCLASPVPVLFETLGGNTHGYYRPIDADILIRNDMSQKQTIKTMIHEITHALLHYPHPGDDLMTRNRREIEAESTAYAVSSYYGIDTSEYSFPYIAGWSENHDLKELRDSLDVIRSTTDRLIATIDCILDPMKKSAYLQALTDQEEKSLSYSDRLS